MGLHSVGSSAKSVQEQLDEGYVKMASLQESMSSLQDRLVTVTEQQSRIIELYDGVTILIKVFAGMEKLAVWVTKMAAAIAIVWLIWKFAVLQVLEDFSKGKPGV